MTKLVKKEIQKTCLFILGGGLLAGLGYFQTGTNQQMLYTLGFALAVIGIATILIYLIIGTKPKYQANMRAEKEERSVFIRRKTGHLAFWLTYPAILISSNIDYFSNMGVGEYAIYITIYMGVIYIGAICYFITKH